MLQGLQTALTCCLHAALSAGAMLFDARQLFEQREAKADAALRAIASRLPEAVATCLDAAAADLDAPRQAALLKVCPGTLPLLREAFLCTATLLPTCYAAEPPLACCLDLCRYCCLQWVQQGLRRGDACCKFLTPEIAHLTLHF